MKLTNVSQILNDVVDEWDLSKCKGIIIECRLQNHGSAVQIWRLTITNIFPQTNLVLQNANVYSYSTMMYGDNDYAFNRSLDICRW